jgi:hypothetical protein
MKEAWPNSHAFIFADSKGGELSSTRPVSGDLESLKNWTLGIVCSKIQLAT